MIEHDRLAPAAILQPVWKGRQRLITCHRADLDSTQAPNSLNAVRAAVGVGAPRIEIDVRFLADDTMVVFHDPDLAPTTDRSGPLDRLTIAAVREARALGPGAPPIALFDEVVDAVAGSGTTLHVDLKHDLPMPAARLDALASALAPIASRAIVGTQAYWNLTPLAQRGLRVAIDPGYLWQRGSARVPTDQFPRTQGLYGFWDDAPLAHIPGADPATYLAMRLREIALLVPAAEEWMVDIDTIRHCDAIGVSLASFLHARDIRLVAWTIVDPELDGPTTAALLALLFDLEVDTIIAKHALVVAGYLSTALTRP